MATSKRTLNIDMSGVEKGGGSVRVPEDDYHVKIIKIEKGESQAGNAQLKVSFEIIEPEAQAGKVIKDYVTLTEKALWRLGNLLDALNIKWSPKALSLPLDKIEGKEMGITVSDDEYNNKVKSKVSDYLDLATIKGILDGTDGEDDDDDDDDDEDDEDEAPTLDELKAKAKKAGLKVNKLIKGAKNDAAASKILIEALDDEDDDDEDDDVDELDVDDDL